LSSVADDRDGDLKSGVAEKSGELEIIAACSAAGIGVAPAPAALNPPPR
jgi:hypothetical protein